MTDSAYIDSITVRGPSAALARLVTLLEDGRESEPASRGTSTERPSEVPFRPTDEELRAYREHGIGEPILTGHGRYFLKDDPPLCDGRVRRAVECVKDASGDCDCRQCEQDAFAAYRGTLPQPEPEHELTRRISVATFFARWSRECQAEILTAAQSSLTTRDSADWVGALHAMRDELAAQASALGWPLDGNGIPLPECKDESR